MKSILFITLLLFVLPAIAGKPTKPLTVEDILADGYKQMTGKQIHALLEEQKLVVLNLTTGARYESVAATANKRTQNKTAEEGLEYLTNPELHGQAPAMDGASTYTIENNTIKSTDGVRSHVISLYRKKNRVLGTRDVDHRKIIFEVILNNKTNNQ